MAELCTTIGDFAISFTATSGVTPTRGLRLLLASDGTYGLAGLNDAGNGHCQYDVPISGSGTFKPLNAPGSQVAVASEAIAVGDRVYSVAGGKVSKTATSAIYLGIAKQAASGNGVLFEYIPNAGAGL